MTDIDAVEVDVEAVSPSQSALPRRRTRNKIRKSGEVAQESKNLHTLCESQQTEIDALKQQLATMQQGLIAMQERFDSVALRPGTELAQVEATAPTEPKKLDDEECPAVEVKAVAFASEYELNETVWEAPLIMTASAHGVLGSSWMYFLILLNIAMQGLFIFIIWNNLLDETVTEDKIQGFAAWRRDAGQDLKNMDTMSRMSLAEQVCTGSEMLVQGSTQSDTFEELVKYLGGTSNTLHPGPLMAMGALLVWMFSVFSEISSALRLFAAVWELPTAGGSPLELGEDGESLEIVRVSMARKVVFILLQLARLFIAGFLLHTGSVYLVRITSIADLIYNMVALEFVLNVDEILFSAMGPLRVRHTLGKCAPLKCKRLPSFSGLDICSIMGAIVGIAGLTIYTLTYLNPQTTMLIQERDVLCGGNTNFVYAKNGMGVVAWATTSDTAAKVAASDSWPTHLAAPTSFARTVLHGPLNGNFGSQTCPNCFQGILNTSLVAPNWTMPQDECCIAMQTRSNSISAGWLSLEDLSTMNTRDSGSLFNPTCADMLLEPGPPDPYDRRIDINGNADIVNHLRGIIGAGVDLSTCGGHCPRSHPMCQNGECVVPTCSKLTQYCQESSEVGLRVRQICGETCGCTDPIATGLVLSTSRSGCSPGCVTAAQTAFQAVPCQDSNHTEGTPFRSYIDNLALVSSTWPASVQTNILDDLKFLPIYGCEYIAEFMRLYYYPNQLCEAEHYPITPIKFFCPVACGTCSA